MLFSFEETRIKKQAQPILVGLEVCCQLKMIFTNRHILSPFATKQETEKSRG